MKTKIDAAWIARVSQGTAFLGEMTRADLPTGRDTRVTFNLAQARSYDLGPRMTQLKEGAGPHAPLAGIRPPASAPEAPRGVTVSDRRSLTIGKSSLIGVFEGLRLQDGTTWPAAVRVAGHLRVELEPGDPPPDEVTFTVLFRGATMVEGGAPIVLGQPILVIGSPSLVIPVAGAGEFIFRYAFKRGGASCGAPLEFRFNLEG